MEATKEVMNFTNVETEEVSFKITSVYAESVGIEFQTIIGNNPSSNGNYLAIWQAGKEIPWNEQPNYTQQIGTATKNGTVIFSDIALTNESYIVGYSTVPLIAGSKNNFCASGFIESVSEDVELDLPENYCFMKLELNEVTSNALRVTYTTLPGYNPIDNLNWIGIWEGKPNLYSNKPLYSRQVDRSTEKSAIVFNNIIMKRNTRYTIGYFMNGWSEDKGSLNQKGLAATLTFTVS